MFLSIIQELQVKLQQPLPGEDVQFQMAHLNREKVAITQTEHFKQSAVIVLLFPDERNQCNILLIERSKYNGHHSGQIAFPGGKAEIGDKDLNATALREFFEETGCIETPIIIGELSALTILVSKFIVTPFVAYLLKAPIFKPNHTEVASLISWKLDKLLLPESVKYTSLEPIKGLKIQTPYFDANGKIVWGATAMILNELKYILKDIVS